MQGWPRPSFCQFVQKLKNVSVFQCDSHVLPIVKMTAPIVCQAHPSPTGFVKETGQQPDTGSQAKHQDHYAPDFSHAIRH